MNMKVIAGIFIILAGLGAEGMSGLARAVIVLFGLAVVFIPVQEAS